MHRVVASFAVGLVLCSTGLFAQQTQFTILPFAGAPRDIGDNGPATSALLNDPHGVSVDASGNLSVTDTSYNLLRRVSASGIITTGANQLRFPWHSAAAPNGDLYVADAANNRILKVASSGTVTTFAPSVTLNSPRDVAVDSHGNVFILDSGHNRVLKATPDGSSVAAYAGTGRPGFFGDGGPASLALLNFPYGIALDAAGDLFISDSLNQRIRVVTAADQNISTIAGTNKLGYNGDNSPLATAFNYPAGLAVDASGTLYIADTWNHLVRKITQPVTPNAAVTTIAGTGVPGFSGDGSSSRGAQLNFPYGVAVDAQGNILIADSSNNRIRKISTQGIITTVAGSDHGAGDGGPALTARMFGPSGIAIDTGGNVYISDTNNNRVRRVSTDGTISLVASGLNSPNGLAFYAGALYIADTNGNVIRKVIGGSISVVAGVAGVSGNDGDNQPATSAHLEAPNALAFDIKGNMYIADSGNNRVRVVGADGTIRQFAGDARQGLPGNDGDGGSATSAHLNYPRALAFDSSGNLYIADFFNDRVRMVAASTGNITTFAGTGVRGGAGEGGPATQAQLALPASLAFDNLGNLYIADSLNNRIRMVAANGTLHSVAGGTTAGDAGDGGPALEALIASPRDVAIDSKTGILYFSDQDNDRVRQLVPGLVTITQVLNAASFAGGSVAPGETVSIYGTQLAPVGVASSVPASVVALSTMAANTQVLFDGIPAPFTYLSAGQINAVVPYEVAGKSSTNIVVQTQGRRSDPFSVPVAPAAPGVFTNSLGSALNQDGSENTPSNPAHVGDTIVLFATGEGQTNPPGVTGKLAVDPIPPAPVLPVVVQIGNQTAALAYAGSLPQGAGVLQINAVIPDGTPTGDRVPVTLSIGGVQAQSGITISVR